MQTPERHEKVCPRCRCAYQLTAETCSDCNVQLVFPDQLDEQPDLPSAEEMAPVRIASMTWCRAFSEFLSARGIAHRIDEPPRAGETAEALKRRSHDHSLAVYVMPDDLQRAMEADALFVREQIPDLPEDGEGEASDEHCPACGHALDASASECPDCGLFVGEG